MKVLFVCSGNTCRSPLAVAAWRAFAPRVWDQGEARTSVAFDVIDVSSAGLAAWERGRAADNACAIARSWGIDLRDQRSRRLTADIAGASNLICAMTTDQAATIRLRFAISPACVGLLGDFAPGADDSPVAPGLSNLLCEESVIATGHEANNILDPYGGSLEAYQTCAAQIRDAVTALAQAIRDGFLDTLGERTDG